MQACMVVFSVLGSTEIAWCLDWQLQAATGTTTSLCQKCHVSIPRAGGNDARDNRHKRLCCLRHQVASAHALRILNTPIQADHWVHNETRTVPYAHQNDTNIGERWLSQPPRIEAMKVHVGRSTHAMMHQGQNRHTNIACQEERVLPSA